MPTPAQILVASRLVADLHCCADQLRARRYALAVAADRVHWKSLAAVAFSQRVQASLAALTRCADQFDAAANRINALAVVD